MAQSPKKSFRKNKIKPITGDALDALGPDKSKTTDTHQPETSHDGTKEESTQTDKPKKKKPAKVDQKTIERKSFLINAKKFDKFLDLIYTKKLNGDFRYTQEQGLDEALELLFATEKKIVPRPEEERALERKRSERIKGGKNK
tara:strand:+ start:774 stop:1202 length:429 start_codon:yes stop_codon:yes gene_type:complete